MTLTLVQSKVATGSGSGFSVTFDSAPGANKFCIGVFTERSTAGAPRVTPTGWTKVADFRYTSGDLSTLYYTNSAPSATVTVGGASNSWRFCVAQFSGVASLHDYLAEVDQVAASSYPIGPASYPGGLGIVIGACVATDPGGGMSTTFTEDALFTRVSSGPVGGVGAPFQDTAYRVVSGGSSYGYNPTSNRTVKWGGVVATFLEAAPPIADFSADEVIGAPPLAVQFTDLSAGVPTSWLWDFGDGSTSTSQNPSHTYTTVGTYSVTLTATNANGSDSETKTTFITVVSFVFEEPIPAGVLLEIYAAAPGSARWDVAVWDVDEWSTAGWRDVTPYGIHVNITWGSSRPELGILSTPQAASWTVDYYDPDRILDPANEEGPYFGDLIPFLPIRVSHRGTVVRVGYASGISHNYAHGVRHGYMRGADNISILANAMVPPDTALSDTLYARAVDAIAAAGLTVTVGTFPGVDPPLTAWVTGTREWSVWEWITDAAQEVLHVPYINRYGNLGFRAWASPLSRGRSLTAPELIDLGVVTDYSGLFSVVQARLDVGTVVERALTPPPRYGARTYTRDEDTIDPGDWADAVLADRAMPTLLWKPGQVYPLTALAVERYATIEAVERVSISLPSEDPPVFASGIVVGGEIDITGKYDDEAKWRFRYEVASTATEPLIETGGEPTDYLLATGGDQFLYPTGSA